MIPTYLDGRWHRFNDRSYRCPCCGQSFGGVFDLGAPAPMSWPGAPDVMDNSAILEDGDVLTEDFCRHGAHHFVRGRVPFRVKGTGSDFAFTFWGSLKRENFDLMLRHFDSGTQGQLPEMFTWISNAFPNALGAPTAGAMKPQNGRKTPILTIVDEAHPYFALQRDGLMFDQLLDIYATSGIDLRPHLKGI